MHNKNPDKVKNVLRYTIRAILKLVGNLFHDFQFLLDYIQGQQAQSAIRSQNQSLRFDVLQSFSNSFLNLLLRFNLCSGNCHTPKNNLDFGIMKKMDDQLNLSVKRTLVFLNNSSRERSFLASAFSMDASSNLRLSNFEAMRLQFVFGALGYSSVSSWSGQPQHKWTV